MAQQRTKKMLYVGGLDDAVTEETLYAGILQQN
jgi:hypothetical protein